MRGKPHATSRSFENYLAYIHGRIEHEIETFADRLSVSPLELTARLGALLSDAGEWTGHQLPSLPLAAGGRWGDSAPPSTLESAVESHGGEAPYQAGAAPRGPLDTAKGRKISAAQRAMWGSLTPRERSAKMLARDENIKHPDEAQKKAMATLRAQLAGKKNHGRHNPEKQRIYVARSNARRLGLPLPPLPKEMESTESKEERRRRLDREYKQAKRDAQKAAAAKYKGKSEMAAAAKSAWAGMDFAQRQAEMRRRQKVAQKNRAKKDGAKKAAAKKAATEGKVVWNKPAKKTAPPTYVNAGAPPEVRPETETPTGT